MGYTNQLILKVSSAGYKKLSIDTNDGKRFHVDLSKFVSVYCFPSPEQWDQITIDSYGLNLIWPSRFEVHIDQLIPIAFKEETLPNIAS